MADKPGNDRDVLTSLPRTRPVRRSAKRGGSPASPDTESGRTAESEAANEAKPAAAGRSGGSKSAGARPPVGTRKAAGRKVDDKTTPTAGSAASGRSRPAAAGERSAVNGSSPAPQRKVPPAGYAAPRPPAADPPGSGEILGTALQAAGELAQIGLTVSRQALRSALGRLPRP